ncbi:lipocalin family protein [Aquimarina sp. ERC-38]|uniref:lipocalin family protein n=1 Tax=Aquimarina sp. ERC-38 TaxID=2949996 RepID=UPI002246A236|nr:lipocalin family protein [Aquimarina sp. ERC-38]UZO79641.1 lipocalin family protein [Aquimarina sp. ERC-38]
MSYNFDQKILQPFILLTLVACICFLSCNSEVKKPYLLPENAIELISGSKGKTWKIAKRLNNDIRMNMGDCFLSYRQTYFPNMTMQDNNGDYPDCGPTLKATWEMYQDKKGNSFIKLKSEQLPQLLNTKENYKYFQILEITDSTLQVTYQHKQFSNKTMWIKDFYVKENIKVPNRDFHNR